ncbi:Glu/Leu/Phe/Val dehydrogenase [bacterium]|nr:Glu/Leu/Phe/Val dehydrogenase [bacterium]MBU1982889.1 Glu/Leu/Phe/Val dehydrogenase [bacterium]
MDFNPPLKGGLYEHVLKYFDQAADRMGLDLYVRKILRTTASEILVHFPVKMDDGRVEMMAGYRIQHCNVLGPFIGGMRFHPDLNQDMARGLACLATFRAALINLPCGGAQGGLQIAPSRYTMGELERLTRRFTYALGSDIGPEYDISAPDINTDSQIMVWMLDTYVSTLPPYERGRNTHVVTGKPLESGGTLGREKGPGQGIVYLLKEWARDRRFGLYSATFAVQGFGNVGSWTARLLKTEGCRMVAVEDNTGAIHNKDGIDPDALYEYVKAQGGVKDYPQARAISHEDFFGTKCDIFIPAAVENQITAEIAENLNVRLIAEGANGPLAPEADVVFEKRGIDVIPDILCNSGGAIANYFEWIQNKRSEYWEQEEVDTKLRKRILEAYVKVRDMARNLSVDWRTAAYMVALHRLETVFKERGIFP